MKTLSSTPGSPWENSYNEFFNGALRDPPLRGELFYTLRRVVAALERRPWYYDHVRYDQKLWMTA